MQVGQVDACVRRQSAEGAPGPDVWAFAGESGMADRAALLASSYGSQNSYPPQIFDRGVAWNAHLHALLVCIHHSRHTLSLQSIVYTSD